jgi:GntR family transcriptional regulator
MTVEHPFDTDFDSDTGPLYLKLRAMIAAYILEGRYAEGSQLPSVRTFAATHTVNPLTAAKAYQCLQNEGIVMVKRGIGMFVAKGAIAHLRATERATFLETIWPRMRAHIERLGLNVQDLFEDERA